MWHDTIRFVRCVRETFDLRGPVHEYGMATLAAPLAATGNLSADAEAEGANARRADWTESLDDLTHLPFASGTAGTVACLNVLQHAAEPGAVAAEMIRLLAPGGVLLVCSCTGGQAASADLLWRPAPHAFQTLTAPLDATLIGWQGPEGNPHGIYAIGAKAPVSPAFLASLNRFLRLFRESLDHDRRAVSWIERVRAWLARWSRKSATARASRDYYQWRFVLHTPLAADFRHEMLAACFEPKKIGLRLDSAD